ncbi:MAG TPA: type II toxin-antitoxin system VapC family toxin [Candidatus Kapabacteria bacterium]|jgi:ribonuclease VapC
MNEKKIVKEKTDLLVFDAYPLLVLFRKQTGWERVREILADASRNDLLHCMSLINLGEVFYSLLRSEGETLAQWVLKEIQLLPLQIINPTYEQMLRASRFKAQGGISFADCFAAALAQEYGIPILTGDREFEVVERQGIAIEWLPKNR